MHEWPTWISFNWIEMARCNHIGLFCTPENAELHFDSNRVGKCFFISSNAKVVGNLARLYCTLEPLLSVFSKRLSWKNRRSSRILDTSWFSIYKCLGLMGWNILTCRCSSTQDDFINYRIALSWWLRLCSGWIKYHRLIISFFLELAADSWHESSVWNFTLLKPNER